MPKVTLYGTTICPYCVAARRLLKSKNIAFEDVALDGQAQKRAEVMARCGGHTVPQIWIGDTHVGGYSELYQLDASGQLRSLLE